MYFQITILYLLPIQIYSKYKPQTRKMSCLELYCQVWIKAEQGMQEEASVLNKQICLLIFVYLQQVTLFSHTLLALVTFSLSTV